MMITIPESAASAAGENAQNALPSAANTARNDLIPLRCSICGKPIACCYPESVPGIIFATCRNGHKIKIRKEDFLRKAV